MATTLEQLATEDRLLQNFQRQTAPIVEPALPAVAPEPEKPVIDPEIAHVPYASATPEQQPPQTNITYLPAEPETPPVPEGAVPYTPTLAEIKEYNSKNGIVDPILDLTAEEIAELEEKNPKDFNLEQEFIRLQPHWNQELFDKATKAYNLLERKGGKINLGLGELGTTAKHAAVGAATWAQKAAKAWGVPFAIAMEKVDELMGLPPSPAAIAQRQKIMREAGEAAAGTEASMTGLAFMGEKAINKLFGKKPELKTDQEQKDSFKAALIPHLAQEQIAKGAGLFSFRPDVREELAQAGVPIRPEEVEKAAAGDPIGFLAFGKGLEGVAGLMGLAKPVVRAATKVPGVPTAIAAAQKIASAATPAKVVGAAVTGAGRAVEAGARLVERVAPIGLPIASALAGGSALSALGALGGVAAGAIAASPVVRAAGLVRRLGAAGATVGRELAGKEAVTGSLTQAGKDVLQSIPSAGAAVGHGAALDLGLAALTNTTPGDQQGLQLGTILGAFQGARRTLGRVVSGQKIAPRAWGSANPVPSSGQFPAFDAMHRQAYSNATPAQRQHINAVQEFLRGVGADTDVFLGDAQGIRDALVTQGYDAATAENFSRQSGMFLMDLPGRDGAPRRVIVLKDADAAPHEAQHAFQDVLGEQANQVIDKVIRETYADEWDSMGQHYAELVLGRRLSGNQNWRDVVLETTGSGNSAALLKLQLEAANRISQSTGAQARAEDVAALVPERLNAGDWRTILTPAEQAAAADKYISREVAAENFDAVFKNLGQSLQERSGVLPWLARIVASTTELLGGNSLAGRKSELGFHLQEPVIEALKGQAREFVPEVTPRTPTTPPRVPVTPRPTPSAPPGTPAQEAEVTRDVAADAPTTPTGPEVGSQSPQEILGTFAEAKARNSGVKITRRSAPGTPAGAIEISRGNRREQIELARSIPDSEKPLWEKNFVPVKTVVLRDGTLQEQGWSPEVFAANAEKLATFLSDTGAASPFEIDPATKSFTAQGWRDLFDKFQIYAGNQAAGLTGRGTPVRVGEAARFGFFEPAGNRQAVGSLTDAEMNFINYLMGFPLPGRGPAVTRGGKAQYGVQKISEATEPGRALPLVEPRTFESKQAERLGFQGEQVLEVNPFRAEIEALAKSTGKPAPSPIEVWQNLNVNDIVRSEVAPELPAARPVGVTTRAGFRPEAKQDILDKVEDFLTENIGAKVEKIAGPLVDKLNAALDETLQKTDERFKISERIEKALDRTFRFRPDPNPRAVKEAAIRDEDGKIFTGANHGLAAMKALEAKGLSEDEIFDRLFNNAQSIGEDGFVDGTGNFLNRKQAHERALELEQITPESETAQTRDTLESELFATERQFRPSADKEKRGGYNSQRFSEAVQFAPQRERVKNPEADEIAKKYADRFGFEHPVSTNNQPLPQKLMSDLGDYFEDRPHAPNDPAVRESYKKFKDEIIEQARFILDSGLKVEPFSGKGEPYPNSKAMIEDVKNNKHLYFLKSEGGFGGAPAGGEMVSKENLMLEPTGIILNGHELDLNEVTRFVHDYFGHTAEGNEFGPRGEFNAFLKHSQLFTPEAQKALIAELLMQAGWYFGGKHIRRADGSIPVKGEPDFIPFDKRSFIEPKNLIPSEELTAQVLDKVNALKAGETKFKPSFKSKDFESELEKVRSGESFGQTFTSTGEIWKQPEGQPSDIVTLASVNVPKESLTGATVRKSLEPYNELLNKPGIVAGVFELNPDTVSVDVNAVVPQTFRENTKAFAKANEQKAIFDADKGEVVDTGGSGETVLKSVPDMIDAAEKLVRGEPVSITEGTVAQFKPKSKKQDDLKFLGTQFGEPSKAWILPNGKIEQLGAQWHHAWLDENKPLQKKYGLDIPAFEGGDTEGVREQAIKKGFARVNLDGARLVVEAREKDWRHIRPIVEDLIERNLDDIDKFHISLLNDKVDRVVKSYADKLFDADTKKEKMGRVYESFADLPKTGEAQFKPGDKGYVGRVNEDGEVEAKFGKLLETNHADLSFGVGTSFRYVPRTGNLFWWGGVPSEKIQDTATAWLENKGYEVKNHKPMIVGDQAVQSGAFAESHGGEEVQFKPKQEAELFGSETDLSRRLPTKESTPSTRATTEFFTNPDAAPKIFPKKPGMFELMDYLSKRSAKLGKLNEDTAENNSKIAETLADEAEFALSKDNNALGWYDRKIKAAIKHITELHPELAKDPEKLMAFKAMLAITSNGMDIRSNFARADELYEGWKKTGKIETDSQWGGKTAGAINAGLKALQTMIAEKGLTETKAFLEGNYTVKELENLGFKIPGEAKGTRVNGSVIFGPKIGSFFANLNGDFSPVTMDRWFMRTFRRITGNLTDPSVPGLPKQIDRVLEALAGKRLPEIREQLKQLKKDAEDGSFDPADAEGNREKYGDLYDWIKTTYRKFAASRFADRSDFNMGVKNLHVNLFEANEAPNSGSERQRIRNVMAEAQAELKKRGIEIVNADLQALLWYYEKDLYKRFGVGTKRGQSADYETAAKELLESKRGGKQPAPTVEITARQLEF